MLKKMKIQKYFILGIVIMMTIIIISFFQFFKENFSYVKGYYEIKEYCYEKANPNHEYCQRFKDENNLKKYIEQNDPKKVYSEYDTFTMTCTIIQHTIFNVLQYFSPLLIAIVILGTLHSEFSSGMFENYLMQMDYKKYLKKVYKIALKASLLTPLSLLLIFVISSILTGFNFDYSEIDTGLTVYNEWKYSNFFLYGFMICMMQFFISLLYSNIALYCCKRNKNKLVSIIMSFVMFLVVDIVIYIIIYAFLLNNVFGLKGLTDYFNIAGYWYFNYDSNLTFVSVLISFFLQTISFVILYNSYKNKEQVILSYEKQVS